MKKARQRSIRMMRACPLLQSAPSPLPEWLDLIWSKRQAESLNILFDARQYARPVQREAR
jgi:hypothetical protein